MVIKQNTMFCLQAHLTGISIVYEIVAVTVVQVFVWYWCILCAFVGLLEDNLGITLLHSALSKNLDSVMSPQDDFDTKSNTSSDGDTLTDFPDDISLVQIPGNLIPDCNQPLVWMSVPDLYNHQGPYSQCLLNKFSTY